MKYVKEVLITAIAPLLFSTTYIVTSEFLPSGRPYTAALFRVLPAGMFLLLWQRQLPKAHECWRIVCLALLNISVFQALLFIAAYRLPGGQAALVMSLSPLLMIFLVSVIDRQRLSLWVWVAALLCIVGVALFAFSPELRWDRLGLLAALGGTVCFALGTWLTSRWQFSLSLLGLTGWQLLLGGVFLLPAALWLNPPLPPLGMKEWLAYAYLAVLGGVVAYGLFFRGIQKLSPVAISALGLLSPIGALFWGWLFLGQAISGQAMVGVLLTLVSIMMIQWFSQGR